MAEPITFIVPGPIEQITGGYLYDRRIIEGLRAEGRPVGLLELMGEFPDADWTAKASATSVLGAMGDGTAILHRRAGAAGVRREALPAAAERLDIVVLVHHVLALETGLSAQECRALCGAGAQIAAAVPGAFSAPARAAPPMSRPMASRPIASPWCRPAPTGSRI